LYADVSEHSICSIFIGRCVFFINTCLWRWNRQCSETSAYKIQTPGNYPEEKKRKHTTFTTRRKFEI
jgi:hypothetical protein